MAVSNNKPAGDRSDQMALTKKSLLLLVIGFLVMVGGYICMMGGGSENKAVFNEAMFNFRRLVLAPILIIAGLVIEIVAIMKQRKGGKQ